MGRTEETHLVCAEITILNSFCFLLQRLEASNSPPQNQWSKDKENRSHCPVTWPESLSLTFTGSARSQDMAWSGSGGLTVELEQRLPRPFKGSSPSLKTAASRRFTYMWRVWSQRTLLCIIVLERHIDTADCSAVQKLSTEAWPPELVDDRHYRLTRITVKLMNNIII